MDEILSFVKKLGVGVRHPHDKFLEEGNNACKPTATFGICDFDNEEFYHEPYSPFGCHIAGCNRVFETVIEYESHYNSCHALTCNECGKNLPNSHFLDLHISETHDSFFMELAKRKPMYKCFLEECKECFKDPKERRDHAIKIHNFPSDFRYDASRKKTGNKKNNKEKKVVDSSSSVVESMDTGECNEKDLKMDISENKSLKTKPKNNTNFRGFSFGLGPRRGRRPVFQNFTKDLMKSLPDS